jgi:iron complex outermembrane receptor protein
MFNHTNLTLAWLNDTSGFYRAYPGAVVLQDQYTFNLDPFLNYYSSAGYKHSFKSRVLYNYIGSSNEQTNRSTVYYADYNFKREYDFLKDFSFIGGLSFQYNDVNSQLYDGSGSPKNHMLNLSGYAEFENSFFNIINFSFGARMEYYSLNDSITEMKPILRAGASLKLMQETFLRLSIGQGYRYPTIAERYIYTNMGSFAVFNNPDLKPESSWNAEVGIKQGFKFMKFFGYLDVAIFQQEYKNTIEYLFGFWDSTFTFAMAGFRFLNTGESRITGIDISLNAQAKISDKSGMNIVLGYNYIMPKTLEPDLVFAKDYNPGGKNEFSYVSTSIDPSGNILKYRFLHTLKADVEYTFMTASVGVSAKYFSRIENLDKAIKDFEDATINSGGTLQPILYMDYFNNHNNGNIIMDLRLGYEFRPGHKVSFISENLLNRWYSLRPLKAEPMRNIRVQYSVKF